MSFSTMRRKYLNGSLLIIIAVLILGSPSEESMLLELQNDFGAIHPGVSLSTQELKQIGKSSYSSYLVCSSYSYSFGTIQVKYFGIAFMKFYMGSSAQPFEDSKEEEQLQTAYLSFPPS